MIDFKRDQPLFSIALLGGYGVGTAVDGKTAVGITGVSVSFGRRTGGVPVAVCSGFADGMRPEWAISSVAVTAVCTEGSGLEAE
jgi:hypothetical protein